MVATVLAALGLVAVAAALVVDVRGKIATRGQKRRWHEWWYFSDRAEPIGLVGLGSLFLALVADSQGW